MANLPILLLVLAASFHIQACHSSKGTSHGIRRVAFSDIQKEPSLVRQRLRFRACLGIPITTVVDDSEDEFLLLFPCDHKRDESLADVALLARLAPDADIRAIADANTNPGDIIEADFSGTLSKEPVEGADPSEYPVFTIELATEATASPR